MQDKTRSAVRLLIRMLFNDIEMGRTIVRNSEIQTHYASLAAKNYFKQHSPETWARAWRHIRANGMLANYGIAIEELPRKGSEELITRFKVFNNDLFAGAYTKYLGA